MAEKAQLINIPYPDCHLFVDPSPPIGCPWWPRATRPRASDPCRPSGLALPEGCDFFHLSFMRQLYICNGWVIYAVSVRCCRHMEPMVITCWVNYLQKPSPLFPQVPLRSSKACWVPGIRRRKRGRRAWQVCAWDKTWIIQICYYYYTFIFAPNKS